MTVLQRYTEPDTQVTLSPRARGLLWAIAALNVMAASWMVTAGDWMDHQSRVSAVITLGGHHVVVLWLAVLGFGILAVLAPMTGGFAMVNRAELVALSLAGVVSVVALAGVLSVAILAVGVVLLVGVIGRAFVR
jgi:hypothetical protein